MKIYVNGDEIIMDGTISISDLLDHYHLHAGTIIVERNQVIVPDNSYESTLLKENDEIELLSIFGGG